MQFQDIQRGKGHHCVHGKLTTSTGKRLRHKASRLAEQSELRKFGTRGNLSRDNFFFKGTENEKRKQWYLRRFVRKVRFWIYMKKKAKSSSFQETKKIPDVVEEAASKRFLSAFEIPQKLALTHRKMMFRHSWTRSSSGGEGHDRAPFRYEFTRGLKRKKKKEKAS